MILKETNRSTLITTNFAQFLLLVIFLVVGSTSIAKSEGDEQIPSKTDIKKEKAKSPIDSLSARKIDKYGLKASLLSSPIDKTQSVLTMVKTKSLAQNKKFRSHSDKSNVNDNIGVETSKLNTKKPPMLEKNKGNAPVGIRKSIATSSVSDHSISPAVLETKCTTTPSLISHTKNSLTWKTSSTNSYSQKDSYCLNRSPQRVSKVINDHNSEVQECYQKLLKLNPTLKGKMVVRIVISPLGSVSEVQVVSSTVSNTELEATVVKCLGQWDDFGICKKEIGEKIYIQEYVFGD